MNNSSAAMNSGAVAANNSKAMNSGAVAANNSKAMNSGAVAANAGAPAARRNATRRNNMMGGARRAGKVPAVGTKAQVYHGTAKHTSGGLVKKDLMLTKKGRIVSRKKHAAGKKALKRLVKAGYKAKKGSFKLMRKH